MINMINMNSYCHLKKNIFLQKKIFIQKKKINMIIYFTV